MESGTDWGYFPNPAEQLFISDTPGQEKAARREFASVGLALNFFIGSRYLGGYLGTQEELAEWVKTEV